MISRNLSRRRMLAASGGAFVLGTAAMRPVRAGRAGAGRFVPVLVGTYTVGTKSKGIYRVELDTHTGALGQPVPVAETVNPSFLAIHPAHPWVYAVNEVDRRGEEPTGGVSAFRIDGAAFPLINQVSSRGTAPCHVAITHDGRVAVFANYTSGTVGVAPIDPQTGRLEASQVGFQGHGSSVDKQRQEGPHAHCARFDPTGRWIVEADLGLDRVHVFRIGDRAALELVHTIDCRPGSGPRHMGFHPGGKFLFVNGELDSSLTAFRFDPTSGKAEPLGTLSTRAKSQTGPGNSTAETVVHPSGKFVYVSNRGDDTIALFRFDAATATIEAAGHIPTGGRTPRNFSIDPAGTWLIAANQDGNNLTVFRIDGATGGLTRVGDPVEVPAPVCVVFDPARAHA